MKKAISVGGGHEKMDKFGLMREFTVIFFSTWKFAATFPVAVYAMKMTFRETLIYTNAGGIIGVTFFLYFSKYLLLLWNRFRSYLKRDKRSLFTPASRRIIKIRKKYGLPGIVILSPVILSIPVGAFLAFKYYGAKPKIFFALIAGQIFWSVVYTYIFTRVLV